MKEEIFAYREAKEIYYTVFILGNHNQVVSCRKIIRIPRFRSIYHSFYCSRGAK